MTLLMDSPAAVSWDAAEPMPATVSVLPIGTQAKTATPTATPAVEGVETDPVLALLTGTALHLTVHGWIRGTLSSADGRYCLVGAMLAVSRRKGLAGYMGAVVSATENVTFNMLARAATARTGAHLMTPQHWNDWHARDLADVLKLIGEAMELRRAELAEAAK